MTKDFIVRMLEAVEVELLYGSQTEIDIARRLRVIIEELKEYYELT